MAKQVTKGLSPRLKKARAERRTKKTIVKHEQKTNPVGIAALILAIVGIIIPTVLWAVSKDHRELVYAVNPIRTTVVSAVECSPDLRVLYRGVDLGCENITSAQVAIWNSGNLSIRLENILKDVVIITEPAVEILDASVRGYHNEETKFAIVYDKELWAHGRIPVSWQILQKNDGDSIQLIYKGAPTVNIYVDGKIEGSGAVKRIGLGLVQEQGWSWKEIFESQKRSQWVWIATVCIAFVFTWLILIGVWRGFINSRGWQRKLALCFTVVPLWLYVAVNYFVTPIFVKWPPFGF